MPSAGPQVRRPMEPPPASTDLGSSDWERALVKTMRERGLLWRSEATYRGWAARFAGFIAPRSPYAASGEEVAAFLSDLAVRHRISPAIRTVQELMGHGDIRTTQIYLHVMQKPGLGVRSPFDTLKASPLGHP